MKISKNQLRQIIREELAQALKEDGPITGGSTTDIWARTPEEIAKAPWLRAGREEPPPMSDERRRSAIAAGVIDATPEDETDAAGTGQSVASTEGEGKSCKMVCT